MILVLGFKLLLSKRGSGTTTPQVAYTPEEAAKGEAAVVDMAVRFGQGAIYAYEPIPGKGGDLQNFIQAFLL